MKYFLGIEVVQNSSGIFMLGEICSRSVVTCWHGKCNVVKNPIVPGIRLSKNDVGTKVDATLFK